MAVSRKIVLAKSIPLFCAVVSAVLGIPWNRAYCDSSTQVVRPVQASLLDRPRSVQAISSTAELSVLSVAPSQQSIGARVESVMTIHFDAIVDPATVVLNDSVMVFGRWSGAAPGLLNLTGGGTILEFRPSRPFSAGEIVTVTLSNTVASLQGSPLRASGYSWQFWTNARRAPTTWSLIDSLSTRTIPSASTRAYGGVAADLNQDGFLDLTLVNEDTADLRVFLNLADRTGLFSPFLQPTFPVNDRASPSETADFNRDGIVDICVANINTASVSILLGLGNGTFAQQQEVIVGATPRGIAVLDADGDGDADIVNTNFVGNNLSLLVNDGFGSFGAPTFFDGGGNEWALASADMDNDGILDLVVGARTPSPGRINVLRGNGNGTFTSLSSQSSNGACWMLVCGDVNGDGAVDVAASNSSSNRSVILLNDGSGILSAPISHPGEAFTIAGDLGDIDGDDDLDWITSSYSGDWFVYTNDGIGGFSHTQTISPPQAASCALIYDGDNDGDLDLCLIDEEADVLLLYRNSGVSPRLGDADDDCDVDLPDYDVFADCLLGPDVCMLPSCSVFDFDDDCDVDAMDYASFASTFTTSETPLPTCPP